MEFPTVEPEEVAEWVVAFQVSTEVLSAIIGLFIAYQAYRGYRRNESRPMLFVSVGFVLVLAIPYLTFLLFGMFPMIPATVVIVVTQTSQVTGLLAILYALWMPV